jgi:hypothetical protein
MIGGVTLSIRFLPKALASGEAIVPSPPATIARAAPSRHASCSAKVVPQADMLTSHADFLGIHSGDFNLSFVAQHLQLHVFVMPMQH